MTYSGNASNLQAATSESSSDANAEDNLDSLLVMLGIEGIEGTPKPSGCPGTLAEFHTNQAHAPDTCTGCAKHAACEKKHANPMDRIERFLVDCFGQKPKHGRFAEPVKCDKCFVREGCVGATQIIRTTAPEVLSPESATPHEAHTASVIAFPKTTRATPTPEAEIPTERDCGSPSEPLIGSLFESQRFVSALTTFQSMDDAALVASLATTSYTIRPAEGKTHYPLDLQCEFLAASFELNTLGIMPLLRPVRRALSKANGAPESDADKLYSNHLRLIDLDYLAKNHPHGRGEIFEKMLNDDGFLNYATALTWVSQWGKGGKKAELLQLTPREQAELFILRSEDTRQRWKRLQKNKRRDMGLINAALRNGRRGGTGEAHWQLYALCFLLDWSVKAVLDAATRCPSMNMSASTIRRALKPKDNWLTKTAKLSATSHDE